MTHPFLLILDESYGEMDPVSREAFLASWQALGIQKGSPPLIYVSHHLEEITPVFQKTLIIKEGKLTAGRDTASFRNAQKIKGFMGYRWKAFQ
jgi:iron complex transport system ATP-binding protein